MYFLAPMPQLDLATRSPQNCQLRQDNSYTLSEYQQATSWLSCSLSSLLFDINGGADNNPQMGPLVEPYDQRMLTTASFDHCVTDATRE